MIWNRNYRTYTYGRPSIIYVYYYTIPKKNTGKSFIIIIIVVLLFDWYYSCNNKTFSILAKKWFTKYGTLYVIYLVIIIDYRQNYEALILAMKEFYYILIRHIFDLHTIVIKDKYNT